MQYTYSSYTTHISGGKDAVAKWLEVVANDDLAVACYAIKELGARPDRQFVILGHVRAGLRIGSRGKHEVSDTGVPIRRAATASSLAHDAVDNAEAVVDRDGIFRVIDGIRVVTLFPFCLCRSVPSVFAAAETVRALFFVHVGLVELNDRGFDF